MGSHFDAWLWSGSSGTHPRWHVQAAPRAAHVPALGNTGRANPRSSAPECVNIPSKASAASKCAGSSGAQQVIRTRLQLLLGESKHADLIFTEHQMQRGSPAYSRAVRRGLCSVRIRSAAALTVAFEQKPCTSVDAAAQRASGCPRAAFGSRGAAGEGLAGPAVGG